MGACALPGHETRAQCRRSAQSQRCRAHDVGENALNSGTSSSWTPWHHAAKHRAANQKNGKVTSAWIHEDNIHTIPKQTGEIGYGNGGSHPEALEHEVVVNAGVHHQVSGSDLRLELERRYASQAVDGMSNIHDHINRKVARGTGWGKLAGGPRQAEIKKRGNITRDNSGDWPQILETGFPDFKAPKPMPLPKSEPLINDLKKGSLQRRFPSKVNNLHIKDITGVADYGVGNIKRKAFPNLSPNDRKRAMHHLRTTTAVKNINGENHFLLHRGHHQEEDPLDAHIESSWTPRLDDATDVIRNYKTRSGKVTSAWVPESRIKTIPKQFGDIQYSAGNPKQNHQSSSSNEIILHPGKAISAKTSEVLAHRDNTESVRSGFGPFENLNNHINQKSVIRRNYTPMKGASPEAREINLDRGNYNIQREMQSRGENLDHMRNKKKHTP